MSNTIEILDIVRAGTAASKARQKTAAENIAHANTTGSAPGDDPYRRKMVLFKDVLNRETGDNLVDAGDTIEDPAEFIYKLEPGHPAADEQGYVKYPNVNVMVEKADFTQAGISYKALIELMKDEKQNMLETLRLLDGN